jgi:SAM-dependent methyltransferase
MHWGVDQPDDSLVTYRESGFRPARVLELGCGDGINATFMAKYGSQVTAVDISSSALQLARARAQQAGLEQCEFIEGDILIFEFTCRFVRFVFDKGCLRHVPVLCWIRIEREPVYRGRDSPDHSPGSRSNLRALCRMLISYRISVRYRCYGRKMETRLGMRVQKRSGLIYSCR